ncbi:MAG: hypothetical protein KGL39_23220 [Patescibacteria group bacterium]|nr:hypothetical protein [Patescibacteria group bacterium]
MQEPIPSTGFGAVPVSMEGCDLSKAFTSAFNGAPGRFTHVAYGVFLPRPGQKRALCLCTCTRPEFAKTIVDALHRMGGADADRS